MNKVKFLKNSEFEEINPVAFEQFLFHINCEYLNLEKWIGTIATKNKIIQKFKPQNLRNNRWRISMLSQAGWSFSSFGSLKKIKEKFEALAHDEYNTDYFKSADHINNCVKNGIDLFNRDVKKKKFKKIFFLKIYLN